MKRPGRKNCVSYVPSLCVVLTLLVGLTAVAQDKPPAAKPAAKSAPRRTRAPLSKTDVKNYWKQRDDNLLSNEIRLRNLLFEPEENYLDALAKETGVEKSEMAKSADEIMKHVPPAPTVEAVTAEGPGLLARLKEAAQKRSEKDLEPLVHPDLLTEKAKIYDLFDTATYRNHSLGRFVAQDNRRVGVPFFQLTTSQVEKLHYIAFGTSHGKLVIRDIITGPAVAELFLHDEQSLALAKLNDLFRALNDGPRTTSEALKNACTEGFYKNLGEREIRLTRGQYVSLSQVSLDSKVSLDTKSINIVVRVGYPMKSGKKLLYDVEFERVGKDIRIARVRDSDGGTVALDLDIDNYLNRRYGLPDGPPLSPDSVRWTEQVPFYSIATIRTLVPRHLQARDVKKLLEDAEQFMEVAGGEGQGIRATARYVSGEFDGATFDAQQALQQGGTVYFPLVRRGGNALLSAQHSGVLMSVSKGKIHLEPFIGQSGSPEDISIASIHADFERKGSRFQWGGKPGPFLDISVAGSKKVYQFGALGTGCPEEAKINGIAGLVPFNGGGSCAAPATTTTTTSKIPFPIGAPSTPVMVPPTWQQQLQVVLTAIQTASGGAGSPAQTQPTAMNK